MIWRIGDRRTFLDLRRSGRRARAEVLTVTYLRQDRPVAEPPRVAFAIGRRVGSAVDRNRIRRRLRAAMSGLVADPDVQVPPGAYLVSVRPEAASCSYAQLASDLQHAVAKLAPRGRPPEQGGRA